MPGPEVLIPAAPRGMWVIVNGQRVWSDDETPQPLPPTTPTLMDLMMRASAPSIASQSLTPTLPAQATAGMLAPSRVTDAPPTDWRQMAMGMGLRTVPAAVGSVFGPVGGFMGGSLGELAGELYEGRPVNWGQVGMQGALNLLPGLGAGRQATRLGLNAADAALPTATSALAENAMSRLMRGALSGATLAPVSTMGTNAAEGRPLTANLGLNTVMGAATGGATGGAMEVGRAAAPYVARGAQQMRETLGDLVARYPRLADETGAVGDLGPRALPTSMRPLEQQLPEKQWNTLAKQAALVPGARDALRHLKPAEVEPLTRSPGAMANFVETFTRLPDVDYLVAAIKRGAPKRGWYANSRRALQSLFGDDADVFTGVLAATSPQTSVESNLTNALNVFVNWKAAGRPTDADAITRIIHASVQGGTEKSALDAWIDNTVRVLQGGQSVSGPKIDQFWLALRERALQNRLGTLPSNEAMVLDAWMGNLMGAAQENWSGNLTKSNRDARLAASDPGVTPHYLAGVARMRQAAAKAGVSGAEAQEMAWSTAMALYEKASALGLPAREVLERGLLTDADVAGTPDFSSLLRQGEFARILGRDADLAARLPALAALPHTMGDAMPLTPQDARHLLRVADTLDSLRTMRRADTAVETPETPAKHLAAIVPMEAATDGQWSSLLPYDPQSESRIAYASPRIFGAGESLRQQHTLLDFLMRGMTSSRAKGTGSWVDDQGRLQENPLASYGVTVPVTAAGTVPARTERNLRVGRDLAAMTTGQSAATHLILNPAAPRETHDAMALYAGRLIKGDAAKAFAADLRALDARYTPVQSGRAIRVLRMEPDGTPVPIAPADEAAIKALAQRHLGTVNAKGVEVPPKSETAKNVATEGYRSIAQGAKAGSGERVRRVVGPGSEWAQLSAADQRGLDVRVMAAAKELLQTYDMKRVRAERPDEARMLEVLASGGATGLAKALGAGMVLPALALLGVSLDDRTSEAR